MGGWALAMSAASALVRKLDRFIRLSPDDIDGFRHIQAPARIVARGRDLMREGETRQRAYVLHSGWAYSSKALPDGRRQIINFCVPGDLIGLQSALLQASDQACTAITDVTVSEIRHERIREAFIRWPRVAAAVLWSVSQDGAMLAEHLVDIGRRSAIERVAHLLLEMGERLSLVGLASETGFECPLTQGLLADALGLSSVHVNRVLRQMRERGLIAVRTGRVRILDLDGLRRLANFDDGYLDRNGGPRAAAPATSPIHANGRCL